MLDVSYNRLTTLSKCDLGVDFHQPDLKGNVEPYALFIEGNLFNCDCSISWIIDLAIRVEECRKETPSSRCAVLPKNPLTRQMQRNMTEFRCKTPAGLEGVELRKSNLTKCPQNRMISHCTIGHTCPVTSHNPTPSNAIASSFRPTGSSSSELSNAMSDEPEQTGNELDQVALNVTIAIFTEMYPQTEWYSLHSLSMTEASQIQDKSSPPTSIEVSGWVLTTLIVGGIVVLSGLVLAVYCGVAKIQAGRNASHGHVTNMATSYVVNSHRVTISSQNIQADGMHADSIDEADEYDPYAKSYVFDVPQYHIPNLGPKSPSQ
uniref:LRRCT domain-containing protein n=1 Tax=Branchiostoma floridae TaxID=7739 RepID=C3YE44_BRAFL|eukprot:XP_002605342.1 hypothetical protein BRAFLDRAFT_74165 [Branchiostoma floridae]